MVREKEKAEKAAERARKKEAQTTKKASKKPQTTKRKLSQAPIPAPKRHKRSVVGAAHGAAPERAPSPPLKITSRGRNVHLPSKFR
jgi:hypothetical protein